MTYRSDEDSEEGGNPIELYEFVGTFANYYYTTSKRSVLFGGNTYEPIPMQRGRISTPADGDSPELSVELPITTPLVIAYALNIAPPSLVLSVYRLHSSSGAAITYWRGPVTAFTIVERMANLRVPTLMSQRMSDKIPQVNYQGHCNHRLYDSRCAVVRSGFIETPTLSVIDPIGTTLTVSSMGARPTGWANGGNITKASTGETRMVLDHTGTTIKILWPFSANLSIGNPVEVSAGCDHSIDACFNKFSNHDNFSGMPYVTDQNLFSPTAGK